MLTVARYHAVPPQVPAGPGLLDLRCGQSLVAAVIPFPQVGVLLGGRGGAAEGQFGGADGALGRAGEDRGDVAVAEQRRYGGRTFLAVRGERDVRPACVLAGLAPLGLAVPQQ